MKSITLFHEKKWKQQSKRWRWESQLAWISPSRRRSHDWHPDCSLQQDLEDRICQNYRTMVMLKIILNRLQPQAEEIIAKEQAGFRAGRSTTEQIFNHRILCEKYLQHQQNLYHVFIDFKKAFDRVWHEALLATMRKYNINASIIRAIQNLYDKAQGAVLFNGSTGEWFRTTVEVRQGCLLSPTLFNIFLERLMCEALDDHEGSVRIGGRPITNFRFAEKKLASW